MRLRKVMLVFKKDWLEIKRNHEVILPMIIIPLILSIGFPLVFIVGITMVPESASSMEDLENMIRNLPEHERNALSQMTPLQASIYLFTLYFLAPLFLIIPVMVSSVIAADSFAGEKERKTIEALLATPISDSELLLGKVMVSFVPSFMITVISFIAYSILVNILSFTMLGRFLFPNLLWIMLIFCLSPAMAFASICLTVIISAKVKGFREAQQISGMLLLPIIALMLGQIAGIIMLGPVIIGVLTLSIILIDYAVLSLSVRAFKREEILQKLI
ncbi:MAG: ABC transporter permease subunit [Crenarchaeota archaeon]|nr:ABC transporter permease subunit [Thermoproteota archaeon]MDW8033743.1 ABC transporter permease subunit [Nitrososphaerota archaeon]